MLGSRRSVGTHNIQCEDTVFKNYLTFQIAQSFDRSCQSAELEGNTREKLIQSSRKMLEHFAKSLSAKDAGGEYKELLLAVLCLNDCTDLLKEHEIRIFELDGRIEVLSRRLEQLCASAFAAAEKSVRVGPMPLAS